MNHLIKFEKFLYQDVYQLYKKSDLTVTNMQPNK